MDTCPHPTGADAGIADPVMEVSMRRQMRMAALAVAAVLALGTFALAQDWGYRSPGDNPARVRFLIPIASVTLKGIDAVCGIIEGSHLGAQTVRRGGVGPVRSLLGGKPHRPLFFFTSLHCDCGCVVGFSSVIFSNSAASVR